MLQIKSKLQIRYRK